jgi:hypothetical protein
MATRRQLQRQTRVSTALRFGAEARGLLALLREARSNLKTGIKAEEGAAAGIQAMAREALP